MPTTRQLGQMQILVILLLLCTVRIHGVPCSIGQPPIFTLEPQDAVLPTVIFEKLVGASLHCAHDSPNTTVTWYRESMQITSSENRIIHDNGTLEFHRLIANVDLTAEGVEYHCILSNASGSVISRTAILELATFGDWNATDPLNRVVEVTLGSSIYLPCDPPAANPPPVVEWLRNNTTVMDTTNANKYKVLPSGGGLIIGNVNAADIGPTYQCRVTNALVFSTRNSPVRYQLSQVVHYSANLTIFDTLQSTYELPLGSTAEFTCLATANDVNNLDIFYQRTDGNPLGDNTDRPAHNGTTIDHRTTLRINGITEANDGEYECVVRNLTANGSVIILGRHNFTVVVTFPPAITSTPYDTIVYTGDSYRAQCGTTGVPAPIIYYFFNATNITTGVSGVTVSNGELTLANMTHANTGPYQCFANNVRPISSALWIVTVRDPVAPVLLDKTTGNTYVTANTNLTLTVDVSADPPPNATWQHDGGDLPAMTTTTLKLEDYAACPETYQTQLTVIGLTADHSGIYTVTIENRAGMIIEHFERRVEEPAAVTSLTGTGTGERCIVLGLDSILTCTYTGVPTVTTLWYKGTGDDRVNIPTSDIEYVVTHTSATQTTQLTIRNVASDDAGIYGCEATNSVNGTTLSHSLEVDFVICTYPTFTTPGSSEVSVTEEDDVSFNCKGEGLPTVTYEWFYQNETGRYDLMYIIRREFVTGIDEETGVSYLAFSGATDNDEGTYICKITTELGAVESTFTLVVNDQPALPPQIYSHPSSVNVTIQDNSTNVSFNCTAYRALSYYWIKENDNISSTAEGINTSALVLHNILPSDNGHYQCVAVNEYGRSYSNYATLIVTVHPPEVSVTPREEQVRKGESIEFVCSATGLGADSFTYQWFLNDLPVVDQAMPTLIINDVTEDDTGDYVCFVRNPYGGIGQSGVARLILDQSCPSVTVNYTGFSITWNKTLAGVTVEAPCTGDDLNGSVRRRCIIDDLWEEFIECFREETRILFDQATNLSLSINELNVTERISQTSNIATALVNITTPTQEAIYAEDINLAVEIVSTLNNVTETVVTNLTVNDTFFEDTVSVISNLLSETNRDNWEQLERTSPSTSQSLVRSSEQVTKLLSATLTNDTTEAVQTRTNIVIKAECIPQGSMSTMYTFPDEDDDLTNYTGGNAQVMVPNGLLQGNDSAEVTIASTIITDNSVLRLTSGTAVPQYPASPIFSLQINPLPADPNALVNNPILMMFDVEVTNPSSEQSGSDNVQDFTLDDVSCNFYDYILATIHNLNQMGGWSTEGLTVAKSQSNRMSVTCVTTHLTSFAVLVRIQDERPQSTAADEALSIVSYIGCAISLACLCLSIILLSYTMYRANDKTNHLFVNLNLCIALALGLVVFIAGIETATDNEVACKVVAALLQYLFTSAFCWMLCEGVMLYMMLVTVFGNKLNKRRFFFLLGWGPAIPIVAISVGVAHEHYGTDHYCWIESDDGAIAAFIVPIVAIMLVNCVFLGIALKVVSGRKKSMTAKAISNKDNAKYLTKAMIILLPLLGITWIIGILAVNEDTQVFAWIFAILNSLQGAFIFMFHVLRNKQVKDEVRQGYKVFWNSQTLRRLRTGSSSWTTTSTLEKDKTSQSASSNVITHNKKLLTTSFGSGSSDEGSSNTTVEKSRDKTDIIEDSVFENQNLCVIHEEKDTEVEGKDSVEGNHDANEEEKKSEAEEGVDFVVRLQIDNQNQLTVFSND